MRFSVLSSGSKANCTYVEASGTRILIDCGLSGKKAAERLRRIGIDPDSLDAIVVTHEHRDHVFGVPVLSRRHKIPVLSNEKTAEFLDNLFGHEVFETGEAFDLGSLSIKPFSIVHDAVDPVGLCIAAEGLRFGHATDLGRVTPLVRDALFLCNALVLESNYDQGLLQTCDYPWQLKQRISSTHGHLSNVAAGGLLKELIHPELFHVVLGHLSENSNTPEHALQTVTSMANTETLLSFECGSIHEETPLRMVGEKQALAAAV